MGPYTNEEKRKSKKEGKLKGKHNIYKKGGSKRTRKKSQ